MVHKFYAIKDEKAIRKGTIISTVFALVVQAALISWADLIACSVHWMNPIPPERH